MQGALYMKVIDKVLSMDVIYKLSFVVESDNSLNSLFCIEVFVLSKINRSRHFYFIFEEISNYLQICPLKKIFFKDKIKKLMGRNIHETFLRSNRFSPKKISLYLTFSKTCIFGCVLFDVVVEKKYVC